MKKKIAIIMGGYSSEFKISLKSGNVVHKYLDKEKYDSYRIHILKDKWVYIDDSENEYTVNRDDFSVVLGSETVTFDCVFNAIHGTPGEDGLMQAYFKLLGIPQTSCDYYQSALTFNIKELLGSIDPELGETESHSLLRDAVKSILSICLFVNVISSSCFL